VLHFDDARSLTRAPTTLLIAAMLPFAAHCLAQESAGWPVGQPASSAAELEQIEAEFFERAAAPGGPGFLDDLKGRAELILDESPSRLDRVRARLLLREIDNVSRAERASAAAPTQSYLAADSGAVAQASPPAMSAGVVKPALDAFPGIASPTPTPRQASFESWLWSPGGCGRCAGCRMRRRLLGDACGDRWSPAGDLAPCARCGEGWSPPDTADFHPMPMVVPPTEITTPGAEKLPEPQAPSQEVPPGLAAPGGRVAPGEQGALTPQAPRESPGARGLDSQFAGNIGATPAAASAAPQLVGDGGYIDNPYVGTWFRLRYDDAFNDNRPDRAEFFYAKCGCFRPADPHATGPTNAFHEAARRVDFQDLSPYFEHRVTRCLSVFAELPLRLVDIQFPSTAQTNGGLADMNVGFKRALVIDPCRYLTFQFKVYIPTGNPFRGLGTNNVALEPGLLFLRQLSNRSYLQGELRQWVPIAGTDFAGNVIRYGLGYSFDVFRSFYNDIPNPYVSRGLRVTSVTEVVGWTVFNGKQFADNTESSAAGDTIVNLKLGARVSHGPRSLYAGWGHALTGDRWYEDIFRLEYRRLF
jgi:hypothetical protein